MRGYVAQSGIRVTPEQLEMLVPAFDAAWAAAHRSGGCADEKTARDSLARIVVDLVMAGGMRAPEDIAKAAVARLVAETKH